MGPETTGRLVALVLAGGVASGALGQPVSCLVLGGEGDAVRPRLVEVDGGAIAGGGLRLDAIAEAEGWFDRASWVYGLGEFGSVNYSAVVVEPAGGDGGGAGEVWDVHPPRELLAGSRLVAFGVDRGEREVVLEQGEWAWLCDRAGFQAPANGERVRDAIQVTRVESCRVLVRGDLGGGPGGGAGDASGVATTKRGERVEIRPLMDPTALVPATIVPVRVYVEGDSVPGGVVTATHLETGVSQRVVADDKAIATLRIDVGGVWLVEFHAVRREGEALVVYSATVLFEMGGGA
ncbi:MAG: hypothetical protein R3B68_08510 [Phycisphaerales bacterium]